MEARPHTFTYDAHTDQLILLLAEPSEELRDLMARGWSETQAIAEVAAYAADDFCDLADPARAAIFFAGWHQSVKARCTEEFQTLSADNPDRSPEDINGTETLQRLNNIRKGVHMAMQHKYSAAKDKRRQGLDWRLRQPY